MKDVIFRSDGVQEAVQSSDIAEGWDPTCRSLQCDDSPKDADFGNVMILNKDCLRPDSGKAVQMVCQAVATAKASKTTISLESIPVNEYTKISRKYYLAHFLWSFR